jgi:hypothetical protein
MISELSGAVRGTSAVAMVEAVVPPARLELVVTTELLVLTDVVAVLVFALSAQPAVKIDNASVERPATTFLFTCISFAL